MTSPNLGAYNNGATTVSNTPTLIATLSGAGTGGILIQNTGTNVVYLGGSAVAASGANLGVSLAGSGATITVPTVGGPANALYAITASSTSVVAVLFPSGA